MKRLATVLGLLALATSGFAFAADAAAPGVVDLTVRLPNPAQKILFVEESMPVASGPLTLYYPKWIPGDHSPDGPIDTMMGLEMSAGGKRIAWQRDDEDMFAFHLTVPTGADRIEIRFQFPDHSRITPNLVDLTWDHVALYQSGFPTKALMYRPALEIPADWGYASALKTEKRDGRRIDFKPVPFNTLVDSPVIAGKYFREIDLTPAGSGVHRYLDMVGDSAAALNISDAQIAGYRHLIEQAQALFRSHHYDDYRLLLTASDHTSVGGLEHHQSSDDRARSGAKLFADADHFMLDGSLLPHEYTHSWNGKFMRPAGLWQPDFERPQRGELLWVYEGLTVYLGDMLTVRSGLWSAQTWRDVVAYRAAEMAHRTGRDWRPLVDTTRAAQIVYGSTEAWSNWRRQTDFYREGQLLWLAVDMKIRQLSHDKHSVDDFARAFFGVDDGSFVTRTYTYDDVIKALNAVQPFDWDGFLRNWLESVGEQVPLLSGIDASGWRLTYTDKRSGYQNALENVGNGELEGKGINELFSLGLFLDKTGKVEDVLWNGPAFKAGLAPGMKLVTVDGHAYTTQALRDAMLGAKRTKKPLRVGAEGDGITTAYAVEYADGLRYPHLIRAQGERDYLEQILAPLPVDKQP
ncbi:MAG: M61 family metallopeptidase [Proteobacteria bacterium]|nr:M61 family metallopeptidase [Pseudomonadota bacterium]